MVWRCGRQWAACGCVSVIQLQRRELALRGDCCYIRNRIMLSFSVEICVPFCGSLLFKKKIYVLSTWHI